MDIREILLEYIRRIGLSEIYSELMLSLAYFLFIVVLAIILNFIAKTIIIGIVSKIIKRSKNKYDDIILSKKVFNLLSQLIPALVIYYGVELVFADNVLYPFRIERIISFIHTACYIYSVIIFIVVLNSFLNALYEIYLHFPIARTLNIKGYFQVLKILFILIAIVLIVAALAGQSPLSILTGLGAVTAVLLLMFKDSIMGFVATIQLTAFNMLKPGDPIIMPKYGIDGTIVEISIVSVKVLNPDKSISLFPTYSLIVEAFTNYAPIAESGLHKFRKLLKIDVSSIKFCSEELLSKLVSSPKMNEYILVEKSAKPSCNTITNLSLYRKALELYLWNEPNVSNETAASVTIKEQTDKGVFVEITGFYHETSTVSIDEFVSRFMETAFAMLPEYELKA